MPWTPFDFQEIFFSTFALHVPLSRMRIAPVFVVTHAVVVIVAALEGTNPSKEPARTNATKIDVLRLALSHLDKYDIRSLSGLLVLSPNRETLGG